MMPSEEKERGKLFSTKTLRDNIAERDYAGTLVAPNATANASKRPPIKEGVPMHHLISYCLSCNKYSSMHCPTSLHSPRAHTFSKLVQ